MMTSIGLLYNSNNVLKSSLLKSMSDVVKKKRSFNDLIADVLSAV